MTRVSVGAGTAASSAPCCSSSAAARGATSVSLPVRPSCLRALKPSPVTAPAARLPCAPVAIHTPRGWHVDRVRLLLC